MTTVLLTTGTIGTIWGPVGTDTRWGLVGTDPYEIHETMRLLVRQGDKKEKNGYPFTTFTDSSDFLGIIPGSLVQMIL